MINKQDQDRKLFKCLKQLIKTIYDFGASIFKSTRGKCNIEDTKSDDNTPNIEMDIEPSKTPNKITQNASFEEIDPQSTILNKDTTHAVSIPKSTTKRKLITKKIKKPTRKNSVKKLSIKK
jgi:hypothetical protein